MTIQFYAVMNTGVVDGIIPSPLKPLVFPDGAVHIQNADTPETYHAQIAYVTGLSHDELFLLAMWSEACRQREEKTVLILPYLPGARMDRGTVTGSKVYSWALGELVNPDLTITLDPHSDVALGHFEDALRRVKVFPVDRIIRREVQDGQSDNHPDTYVGVIAPDKGAHDRAAAAARQMNVKVYTGGKTRDFATGKLTGFHMEDELPEKGKLLIVDDICDGGGTFIGLAEATGLPPERLDLWVTHGIFSKGFSALEDHFGVIHTTDSFFTKSDESMLSDAPIKVHTIAKYLFPEIDI